MVVAFFDSEYDSFCMMLNNNPKTELAKRNRTKPKFDFRLEKILKFDTQQKDMEVRSMKSLTKSKDRKKSGGNFCLYFFRPGIVKEKCYYKHPECASQNFRQKSKN